MAKALVYPSDWVVLPHTDETVLDAILNAGACGCGGRHLDRYYVDAERLSSMTGLPRRMVRRAATRLTDLGMLEATETAWRLSDAGRTMLVPVEPEQGEAAGPE